MNKYCKNSVKYDNLEHMKVYLSSSDKGARKGQEPVL